MKYRRWVAGAAIALGSCAAVLPFIKWERDASGYPGAPTHSNVDEQLPEVPRHRETLPHHQNPARKLDDEWLLRHPLAYRS